MSFRGVGHRLGTQFSSQRSCMPQALYLLQKSQAKYLKRRQGALKDAA